MVYNVYPNLEETASKVNGELLQVFFCVCGV